jgi:predicted Fe-Mo cluster-binding NifX family protein
MRIAITAEHDNGLDSIVAQHFGHAPYFILADVDNGQVTAVKGIANPFAEAHEPGQIPTFIQQQQANVILSGGMGGRAIQFFEQAGIQAATGARGTARQALENFFGGKLSEAAPCLEHGHDHEHGHEHGHGHCHD